MEKQLYQFSLILILSFYANFESFTQNNGEEIIGSKELKYLVDSIARITQTKYIKEEMGKKMGDFIKTKHQKGAYSEMSYDEFGKQLREDFLEVSDDKHMNAFFSVPTKTEKENILDRKFDDWGPASNFGYVKTEISKENIGYLKIAHFTKWKFFPQAKKAATNAIESLQNTDALIIDLRGNPGGFEDIVAYVLSHFVTGKSFLLQEYSVRYSNSGYKVQTTENLPIKKLPNLPIFMLIDEGTGSAAESFAYMMKHLQRATLIGETTAGAGNGSTYFRVNDKFVVQVATSETINVITKKSWEKTGVIPHIETKSEAALSKAQELAKEAGKKHRAQKKAEYENLLKDFEAALNSEKLDEDLLLKTLKKYKEEDFYWEGDINNLGYDYLSDPKKIKYAQAIFRANVYLYPESPNVYDSFAESLEMDGKLAEAQMNFQKAVDLAEKSGDSRLKIFQDNLERVTKALEK